VENGNYGRVVQVIGPVVDIEFPEGKLPDLFNAIKITSEDQDEEIKRTLTRKIDLTLEAMQHLGNNTARCVAMASTDGLVRGMRALDTGAPIKVPVGRCTLGRIFNVLGEPIDEMGPVEAEEYYPIHRPAPSVMEQRPAREMLETGINVFGQMNEPPGARLRVGLTGLTIAEYFRDVEGQDVLLFIDNIFRFTQAGSEVSALLGRMPSAVGYQPTLATDMGLLQERITSTRKGSITSVQAIYVPADDLTDPAPATTFAHLDGTVVLSRQIAELGLYPAVDPLDSTSRILDPAVVGEEHYNVARGVQKVLQRYKGFKEILEGKHDDIPEQCFYMASTIDEVVARARELEAVS